MEFLNRAKQAAAVSVLIPHGQCDPDDVAMEQGGMSLLVACHCRLSSHCPVHLYRYDIHSGRMQPLFARPHNRGWAGLIAQDASSGAAYMQVGDLGEQLQHQRWAAYFTDRSQLDYWSVTVLDHVASVNLTLFGHAADFGFFNSCAGGFFSGLLALPCCIWLLRVGPLCCRLRVELLPTVVINHLQAVRHCCSIIIRCVRNHRVSRTMLLLRPCMWPVQLGR